MFVLVVLVVLVLLVVVVVVAAAVAAAAGGGCGGGVAVVVGEQSGAISELCWAILGLCHCVAILDNVRPSWGCVGPSWSHLEPILGPSWGYVGSSEHYLLTSVLVTAGCFSALFNFSSTQLFSAQPQLVSGPKLASRHQSKKKVRFCFFIILYFFIFLKGILKGQRRARNKKIDKDTN